MIKLMQKIKRLWGLDEYTDKIVKKMQQDMARMDNRMKDLQRNLDSVEMLIRDRTDVSVDVGVRGPNTVIVTGKYKGVDYVEVFDVPGDHFGYIVDTLKDMKKHHQIRAIDSPMSMKFIINQELGASG